MRALSKVALGGSFVSVATIGGLVVGGVFATTATLVVTDPLAPKASADSLTRFGSCADLLHWYVDHGVKDVGPYGWNGPQRVYFGVDDGVTLPSAASAVGSSGAAENGTDAQASSATGTNTQEADVDEPDVAKTDGRRVVRLVDQRVVVVSDVTGSEPRELGRVSLPIDAYGGELLLAGDHVLVSQADGHWGGPVPMGGVAEGSFAPQPMPRTAGGTRIIDVDISDAAHPRVVHDDTYTGRQVSMRLYGDTVRVVTTTERPELPWVLPQLPEVTPKLAPSKRISEDEALRRNRALVRATTIEDWLPAVVDNLGSRTPTPILDCSDVYHPAGWSGGETTAVTTYDVHDPAHRHSVGVTADGQVVYSSADRLYVASTRWQEPRQWWRSDPGPAESRPLLPRWQDVRTQLHAFALDGTDTRYIGSGHVSGSVRDRWSLDEHDGRLRVAWTRSGKDGRTQNGITILTERGGALVPTATIDRLGLDENIQSVRWFDDFAVLVTFRQMDPLYTIDLTDQDHPRETGVLKIPGYSGYLHPIGDHLLLGLGVDATDQGQSLGAQSAVFDIGDLGHPRRVSQQGFGEQSTLPALEDPRGFTWLPDRRTGLTSVSSWTSGRARLVAVHVSASGQLDARDLATDVGWNARTLPLDDGRVALVDDHDLRVLEVG
jgi:uncharacterized secreted protein with C-terminal beta-propeller domain